MSEQTQQQRTGPLTPEEVQQHIYEIEHDTDIDPNTLGDRLAYLDSFGPRIETEADATEAVRMIRQAEDDVGRAKLAAEAYVAAQKTRLEARLRIYGPRLEEWARANITGKQKSKKLLSGVVGFRRRPGGALEIVDDLALREWVERELPSAINYRRAPLSKEDIKAHVEKAGGVLPPGTRLTEAADTFYVGG